MKDFGEKELGPQIPGKNLLPKAVWLVHRASWHLASLEAHRQNFKSARGSFVPDRITPFTGAREGSGHPAIASRSSSWSGSRSHTGVLEGAASTDKDRVGDGLWACFNQIRGEGTGKGLWF